MPSDISVAKSGTLAMSWLVNAPDTKSSLALFGELRNISPSAFAKDQTVSCISAGVQGSPVISVATSAASLVFADRAM